MAIMGLIIYIRQNEVGTTLIRHMVSHIEQQVLRVMKVMTNYLLSLGRFHES